VFLGALIIGGIAFGYQKKQWSDARVSLNNALAKSSKIQKETESAYSRLALQLNNLKATNKDLQKIIKQRDEDIVAKANIALRWKDKYFKKMKSSQVVVAKVEGEEVDSTEKEVVSHL